MIHDSQDLNVLTLLNSHSRVTINLSKAIRCKCYQFITRALALDLDIVCEPITMNWIRRKICNFIPT